MPESGSVESLAGLAVAAGAPPGPVKDEDSLALKARAWFAEAWHHPLWVKYRREAEEDLGYYIGGEGQWSKDGSKDDLNRIKAAQRAYVSVNHVQAVVDILTGFERQNRFDPKVLAQGEEDESDAKLMTWLLKFVREQADAAALESEVFEDLVITGAGAAYVRIDWTEDPLNGTIELQRLEPGVNVIWDAEWEKDDLADARYVIIYKRTFVDDLVAQYPDMEGEIRAALGAAEASVKPSGSLTEGDPRDPYGSVRAHARDEDLERLFYDATEDEIMVMEVWYREYESVWIVANKETGQVIESDSAAAAKQVAASDPENLTAIRRQKRIIRMGVVLPAAYVVLEEDDTPYDNDTQAYPVVPAIAKRKRDDIYGLVRNLKDPQRIENKRESQVLDILARFANLRPVAEENSLANPHTLENPHDPSPVWVKGTHQGPGWYVPPLGDLFKVLVTEADRMKLAMREISGINTDLLGIKSDDSSGIAIARRQAQGQVISTVFFDNFRKFKRNVNERLAKRIQQVFTAEQVLRLTNEVGEHVVVKINPLEARGKKRDELGRPQPGGPEVFRSVKDFLKYDVVISDAPSTPSMRMMQLLGLLEVLKTVPGLGPVVIDKVVELLDIPDKPEILQRVRAMMGGGGGAPPQPSVGPMSSGGGAALEAAAPAMAPPVAPPIPRPAPRPL